MASTVFYNRGVLIAALHVECHPQRLKAKAGGKITGVDTKAGFEKISNFTSAGWYRRFKITPTDHEGGGLVQILAGEGRQVREGHRLVRGVSRRGGKTHQGGRRQVIARMLQHI